MHICVTGKNSPFGVAEVFMEKSPVGVEDLLLSSTARQKNWQKASAHLGPTHSEDVDRSKCEIGVIYDLSTCSWNFSPICEFNYHWRCCHKVGSKVLSSRPLLTLVRGLEKCSHLAGFTVHAPNLRKPTQHLMCVSMLLSVLFRRNISSN